MGQYKGLLRNFLAYTFLSNCLCPIEVSLNEWCMLNIWQIDVDILCNIYVERGRNIDITFGFAILPPVK